MNPYSKTLTKINDISNYFQKQPDGSVIFKGQSLELRIPARLQSYGVLEISDVVTTPGVMDMIFDDQYHTGLNLLATITIVPSDIDRTVVDGQEFIVCTLKNGDTMMTASRVIQNDHIVYVLWQEFITAGRVPYFFDYQSTLRLFEHARELTGAGIGVTRSVFEGIVAYLSRDRSNIIKQYRLTDMNEPFRMVALNNLSQSTSGSLSKVNGSYMRDVGLTSALRWQVDQEQPFENLLRGLRTSVSAGDNTASQ